MGKSEVGTGLLSWC